MLSKIAIILITISVCGLLFFFAPRAPILLLTVGLAYLGSSSCKHVYSPDCLPKKVQVEQKKQTVEKKDFTLSRPLFAGIALGLVLMLLGAYQKKVFLALIGLIVAVVPFFINPKNIFILCQ